MFTNPYYDELCKHIPRAQAMWRTAEQFQTSSFDTWRGTGSGFKEYRRNFVVRYAWAIPTEGAIHAIANFSNKKIVEVGAGTGYWAWLLEQIGTTVHAYEKYQKDNHYGHEIAYTKLLKGGPNTLRKYGSDWTLFLCWPPYDNPMAARCLRRFIGRKLVYIGEGEYGCTGDSTFHDMLSKQWNHIASVDIPQWDGLHDYIQMYERK